MAKYLDEAGLSILWGNIKHYFPSVQTMNSSTSPISWTANSGVSGGNIAQFVVDSETGLVSLQGVTTASLGSTHSHGNITSSGTLPAGSTASGDYIVVTNSSGTIKRSAITLGTGSTFLKNDGSWATPTNSASLQISSTDKTNTRFSTSETSSKYIKFTGGTNKFSVTDATGGTDHTFEVAITPSINANVIKTGAITANKIPVWNATVASGNTSGVLKDGYTVDTTTLSSSETAIPTSAAVSNAITGLSGAMHFIGTSTSAITDGGTENPTISGYSGTAKTSGNVVIYSNKEFVWTGSAWELLGDEGSYALKTYTVTGDTNTGLTGGGQLSTNPVIAHATSGATAGSYGDSAAQTPGYGGTFKVPYITVNTYGHVTGISEHTVTIPASDNTNTAQLQVSDTTNKKINTKQSTSNYIQFSNGTNEFTVSDGTNSFKVGVTPSISNNVTYTGTPVANEIAIFNANGSGVIKSSGFTIATSVPSNAVFTDQKVSQAAAITTAGAYPIILAYSTATTAVTNSVNKTSTLTYNPSTKALVTGGTVDGYTLAAASAKAVDTTIAAASTSVNLPTSKAVATFVEGKGYALASDIQAIAESEINSTCVL